MSSPHTVRWGILATGWIAQTFTKDLNVDTSTRGVSDIKHEVVAASSARSADQATKFLKETGCGPNAKGYGSYQELVKDPNVEIIYVATPHSHHYQNVRLCLEAGKHVLCEKAFTVNAAQAKKLVEIAREKKLFLMEAVWTRYQPISIEIRKMITDGSLGAVHRVIADLSLGKDVKEEFGTSHRMVNMDLAGGALLDLGIYSLTWVFQILYHTLPVAQRKPPKVHAIMGHYSETGSDENTTMILDFPAGPGGAPSAHGIAMTNLRAGTDPDGQGSSGAAIRIQGTKGEIQVMHPAYRPEAYRFIKAGDSKTPQVTEKKFQMPGGAHGLCYEADEAARCLKAGKLESDGLSWDESIVIMEVMDEVRKQGGLKYPEKLETLDYPLPHW